jgi:hypothetical protein
MDHRRLVALGAAIVASWSCKNAEKSDELTTRDRARLYCARQSAQLYDGAKKYAELAPRLDSGAMSPDEVAEADQNLTYYALGFSKGVEHTSFLRFGEWLRFCVSIRKIDSKQDEDVGLRFQNVREAIGGAKLHVDKARGWGELAKLAHEIVVLPVRE